MTFPKNGVVRAPKIEHSQFGLLSVVKPENSTDENRWVRGFSQEWNTGIFSAKNWDDTDTTSDIIASDADPTYYTEIKPFFIEVEETLSTFGFLGLDRIERIKLQLEGVTPKALEQELWDGVVRSGESHDNLALSNAAATVLSGGSALPARRALALLEHQIGQVSPAGEQGVIHMSRDVAAILSSNSQVLLHDRGREHLQTFGGTPVIVGGGYSGAGPAGVAGAAASDGNKWIYGTGTVKVYLGNIDVVNDNLSQAYDVSGNQNDMTLKAIRPAAVYFDTTIHLAVRIDLTV